MQIQVSIVILTYNSDKAKLLRTLKSALSQREVDIEIIISDDCSSEDYSVEIRKQMAENGFQNYQLLHHRTNLGTVANYYYSLLACSGEFVYVISPGDFFYDFYTIKKLYVFAQSQNSNVVFGNAVYYKTFNEEQRKIDLVTDMYQCPYFPNIYSKTRQKCLKYLLLVGNNILGACYFRRLSVAKESIKSFVGKIRFWEDYPSLLFCVANNEKVTWFDDYVVWYETGTGVTSSSKKEIVCSMQKDYTVTQIEIGKKYRNERFLRLICKYNSLLTKKDKIKFILINFHYGLALNKVFFELYALTKKKRSVNEKVISYEMIEYLCK